MYLLLIFLSTRVTAEIQWQPDEKTMQEYLVYSNKDRRNQIQWAGDNMKEIKGRIREIRHARIVPGTPGTIYDGVTGRLNSFATESGKTDALVRAQQELETEERRIKGLRDRSKPYWAYTYFQRPPNDPTGTATPFVVGAIFHHESVHKVVKVLDDGCLAELNWDLPIGSDGEIQQKKTLVVVRHYPMEGLVDDGPLFFETPLYVATTEQVLGKTYPVVVPLLQMAKTSESKEPE